MKTIIVTRPSPQGEELCKAIEKLRFKSVHFPTVTIHPLRCNLADFDGFDKVIFISPNAVVHSATLLPSLHNAFIIAVGKGSADALKHHHVTVNATPQEHHNSEGLLALPCMHDVRGNTILIVKGRGGRDYLEKTLRERGANVTSAIVYERRLPVVTTTHIKKLLHKKAIKAIICTSSECLENLITLVDQQDQATLLKQHLIVSSERIANKAHALGFKHAPILTHSAQNETILKILSEKIMPENSPKQSRMKRYRLSWIVTVALIIVSIFYITMLVQDNGIPLTQKTYSKTDTAAATQDDIQTLTQNIEHELQEQQIALNRLQQTLDTQHVSFENNHEKLYLSLNLLDQHIPELTLKKNEDNTPLSLTWQDTFNTVVKKIRALIIIRHSNNASASLAPVGTQVALHQMLHATITKAQYALLQKQDVLYQETLAQLDHAVRTYCDTTDTNTLAFLTSLQALMAPDEKALVTQPLPPSEKTPIPSNKKPFLVPDKALEL